MLMRPAGRGKDAPLERWTEAYGEYREFRGYRLPTLFTSTRNLETGDVAVRKFTATAIDLD